MGGTRSGLGPVSDPARLTTVAVLALTLALAFAVVSGVVPLATLITPGGGGPSAAVVAEDLGSQWVANDLTGYDGQQVYAIARYFPDLTAASEHLDAPKYRLLRILSPSIASIAPNGEPTIIALLALNIAGFGLAVWGGARLLDRQGNRAWLALPAAGVLLLGVATTTDGPVSWGLTTVALGSAIGGRHRWAVSLLVLAALARETTVVAALCIGAGCALQGLPLRRAAWYAAPALVVGVWYVALSGMVESRIPTRVEPLGFMSLDAGAAVVAFATAMIGMYGAWRWRDQPAVALCSLVFTFWMVVYTTDILDPLALLRVNALPLVLGILALGRGPGQAETVPSECPSPA